MKKLKNNILSQLKGLFFTEEPVEFEVFCFNGEVRLIRKIRLGHPDSQSFYTNELKLISTPIPPNEDNETIFFARCINTIKKTC